MTLKKLLLTIAGGVAILGSFLPWLTVSISILGYSASTSTNAFGLGGALYVILAILAILCGAALILVNVLSEKQIKNVIKLKCLDKVPLIAGITLAAIAVLAFAVLMGEAKGLGYVSFGVWFIGIAGVATIVLNFLKNKELDKVLFGQAEKAEKKAAPAKKEAAKKPAAKKSSK